MSLTKDRAKQFVSSRYAWAVLGLLTLIYISSFVDRQIIAVLAPSIQRELTLSNFQVGILYGTAFSFIYALCGIPMGRLADIYSRKLMIVAGLIVWSLMTVVSGFATSLSFLMVARFFVGISESALSPAVYSLLSDYFKPHQRATVFSVYAAGIFLGIGIAFLGGGSIARAYDWRTSLMAVGIPGLFIAGVAWFVIRELPRGITQSEDNQRYAVEADFIDVVKYILRKRTVRYHFLGFSFLAFTGYTILGFIGIVLTDIHDAASLVPQYGWFMLATGLSVMASGKAADWLARTYNDSYRFVMGMVAGLACLPLYYAGLFAESAMAALILIGLANVISSSYNGIAAAILQYMVRPNMRALAGGLYLFIISVVGFGIGPPLTGWLMDAVFTGPYGSARALMLVFACCGVLGSICFWKAMQSYEEDAERE
ncbi:spinster family MFS transporter [Fodinibius sediminis]|uniref:Sugar phosphate permease n=1 Tax=Fodinibius sediminis TaxID=1214077 RepID=A0A521AKR9_9BACT|nr:MFS transporter [Fodinibius sediminis]SMO35392.1 Sugar phosphate permease [Fodinibius sediminis]